MRDYCGDFSIWEKRLQEAEIDFDLSNFIGLTYKEVNGVVEELIRIKKECEDKKGI